MSSPILIGQRVQKHRNSMRNKGFRLIQLWVPDTKASGFAEEAARQSALVARSADAQTTDRLIEAIVDDDWFA